MNDHNDQTTKISHGFKSRASISTTDNVTLNIDNELENFVSTIEENTFVILSIKQKFGLMQNNWKVFKEETVEKLDTFEKQINEIDERVNSTFNIFNKRLDHMELLGFRPSSYHPTNIITINDNHQIMSVLYSADYIYIGTDTSRILIYSGKTMQFHSEIGPIDGTSILQIGFGLRNDNKTLVVSTASNKIHIIDTQKPAQKRTIDTNVYTTWPIHLPTKYGIATFENGTINFYDDSFNVSCTIEKEVQKLFPGPDKLFSVNGEIISIFNMEEGANVDKVGGEGVALEKEVKLPFAPILISSSRTAFVASGNCNDVAIVDFKGEFKGDFRLVNVGGPSKFLFSWGSYYFRMGDGTLIECRDFFDKKDKVIKIGDQAWWPHDRQIPLAVCGIMESTLVTALDIKCILWN